GSKHKSGNGMRSPTYTNVSDMHAPSSIDVHTINPASSTLLNVKWRPHCKSSLQSMASPSADAAAASASDERTSSETASTRKAQTSANATLAADTSFRSKGFFRSGQSKKNKSSTSKTTSIAVGVLKLKPSWRDAFPDTVKNTNERKHDAPSTMQAKRMFIHRGSVRWASMRIPPPHRLGAARTN